MNALIRNWRYWKCFNLGRISVPLRLFLKRSFRDYTNLCALLAWIACLFIALPFLVINLLKTPTVFRSARNCVGLWIAKLTAWLGVTPLRSQIGLSFSPVIYWFRFFKRAIQGLLIFFPVSGISNYFYVSLEKRVLDDASCGIFLFVLC